MKKLLIVPLLCVPLLSACGGGGAKNSPAVASHAVDEKPQPPLSQPGSPVLGDQNILTDSGDANRYYFYPDRMIVDSSSKGKLYSCFGDSTKANVQAVLTFDSTPELRQKISVITKSNSSANFSPVVIMSTQLVDLHIPGVTLLSQGHGGLIGSEMPVSWSIGGADACSNFQKAVASNTGFHISDLSFTFQAIDQGLLKEISDGICRVTNTVIEIIIIVATIIFMIIIPTFLFY